MSNSAILRCRISIRGIVQGIGFRPFVYNLAQRYGIKGFVLNSSAGVIVEAEADEGSIEEFTRALPTQAPPLAKIAQLTSEDLDPIGDDTFQIRTSRPLAGEFAVVLHDVATCDDCLDDIGDVKNRRFGYPFTNCTNCGPRYTIIRDIPYDRPATTMAPFRMCAECEADPTNRRFHAQPNACKVCGPALTRFSDPSAAGRVAAWSRGCEFRLKPYVASR